MITIILIIILIIVIFKNIKLQEDKSKEIKGNSDTILNNEDYNNKYTKKEYLLTPTELKFYKLLKTITDELNLTICPQVSLYGILRNNDFKDFNKIQSKSIDFVITEQNLKIKMCIELDDQSHYQAKRIKRDEFVNKLFHDLNIKLIRVPVQSFYNLEELKEKIKESL